MVCDDSINQLLASYNTLVIERNNLLVSATKIVLLVLQITEQLDKLKKANLDGNNRYIENLKFLFLVIKKINKNL